MAESKFNSRKLYFPPMAEGGAHILAAGFRSAGVDSEVLPAPDAGALELARQYTSGDECYPQLLTMATLLRVTERPDFDPGRTAFFLPSANGPCRFGQYAPLIQKTLADMGLSDVRVFTPTSVDGYVGVGAPALDIQLASWRAAVISDILSKLLLKTRPYERTEGESDRVYDACIREVCDVMAKEGVGQVQRTRELREVLTRCRGQFRAIPADYEPGRPLIGTVGEIFCRLSSFSNDNIIRRIECEGGECWLSGVSEWVWYADHVNTDRLRHYGRRYSTEMAQTQFKAWFQRREEDGFFAIFADDFRGYEESRDLDRMLSLSEPYLPHEGVIGEMVLSIAHSVYMYEKGADGIVELSPFACMNGLVFESICPKISADHDGIPIRTFAFDGTQTDLDRDIAIYLELARSYSYRKQRKRVYPAVFTKPGAVTAGR